MRSVIACTLSFFVYVFAFAAHHTSELKTPLLDPHETCDEAKSSIRINTPRLKSLLNARRHFVAKEKIPSPNFAVFVRSAASEINVDGYDPKIVQATITRVLNRKAWQEWEQSYTSNEDGFISWELSSKTPCTYDPNYNDSISIVYEQPNPETDEIAKLRISEFRYSRAASNQLKAQIKAELASYHCFSFMRKMGCLSMCLRLTKEPQDLQP